LDLDAGCYALIPFTSGCHLKPREEEGGEAVSIVREEGGRSVFTDACRCVYVYVWSVCVVCCVPVYVVCCGCVVCECSHPSAHLLCRQTLTEVFHRMDLDGNGAISRTEFDFFQEKTSGEICDDDTWKIMQGTAVSQ